MEIINQGVPKMLAKYDNPSTEEDWIDIGSICAMQIFSWADDSVRALWRLTVAGSPYRLAILNNWIYRFVMLKPQIFGDEEPFIPDEWAGQFFDSLNDTLDLLLGLRQPTDPLTRGTGPGRGSNFDSNQET
jgi:hypothetical protein